MSDNNKQVIDKPIEEPKVEEVKTEEPKVEEPKVEEVSNEEPKVEEPVSSSTTPTDDSVTPAGTDQLGRQLYNVKCSKCGKQTQVPFKPSGDRPVYCRDCYMQNKGGGI